MTVFCLNLNRQAQVTVDHVGRLTCECGDHVKPFLWKQERKDAA